jgi:hypothetical protein
MNKKYLFATTMMVTLSGCSSTYQAASPFVSYETSCLGIENDGSQTLRAWGEGRNKTDAVEQAKKNAVNDVIFKGITAGQTDCNMRPLVTEVNARERYEEYFDKFFMDGGEYKKYVLTKDEKHNSKEKQKNKISAKYGVTVRVLRNDLKSRLKIDGVIK